MTCVLDAPAACLRVRGARPQVHLLLRSDKMRASKAMVDRTLANPMITVHYSTLVEDATGNGVLSGLNLVNNKTGKGGAE